MWMCKFMMMHLMYTLLPLSYQLRSNTKKQTNTLSLFSLVVLSAASERVLAFCYSLTDELFFSVWIGVAV